MRETLSTAGFCMLSDVLGVAGAGALVIEAGNAAARARRADGDYYRVNADGSVSSPRRLCTAPGGMALHAIHHEESLLVRLADLLGRRVEPTRASYIYYAPGDYVGLHKDAAVCETTLITCIAGVLGHLLIHPALTDRPAEELLAISRAHSGMPPGGVRAVIPTGGRFVALLGSRVPHHRPAALDDSTIATLCYA